MVGFKEENQIKAIKSGILIDGTGSEAIKNGIIIIENNKITNVGSRKEISIPKDAEIVDLGDQTVLPGFINPHYHCSSLKLEEPLVFQTLKAVEQMQIELRSGVTTLLDLGGHDDLGLHLRDALEHEIITGPRIYTAGKSIKSPAGHGYMGTPVTGEDEIRQTIRDNFSPRGIDERTSDVVKIYITGSSGDAWSSPISSYLSYSEIKTAIDEAHRLDKRIYAHAYGGEGTTWFIEGGGDVVEHGICLTKEQIDLMTEKGTILGLTLFYSFSPYKGEGEDSVSFSLTEYGRKKISEKRSETSQYYQTIIEYAIKKGVKFTIHSDGPYGIIPDCIWILVNRFKLPPLQAIKAATMTAAEAIGILDKTGTLEPGKIADIIAVEGNPLVNIKSLKNVKYIMKDGREYSWASRNFERTPDMEQKLKSELLRKRH